MHNQKFYANREDNGGTSSSSVNTLSEEIGNEDLYRTLNLEELSFLKGEEHRFTCIRWSLFGTIVVLGLTFIALIIYVNPFESGNNIITWLCIITMVTIAGYFYNYDVKMLDTYVQHMDRLYKQLENLFEKKMYMFGKHYNLNQQEEDALNKILYSTILGEDWKALTNSTSYIQKITLDNKSEENYLLVDIRDVFNGDSIFQSLGGYYRRVQMPSVMTGLGILGTFVGLTIGLFGLELSGTSASNLTGQVQQLISSSGTAFSTSLVGIIISLIYTYTLSSYKTRANQTFERIINTLTKRIPYLSASSLLISIDTSMASQNNRLDTLSEDITNGLDSLISEKLPDKIAASLTGQFTLLANQLAYVIQGVAEMKESFETFQSTTSKGIGDSIVASASNEINALGRLLEQVNTSVSQMIDQSETDRKQYEHMLTRMTEHITLSSSNFVSLSDSFKSGSEELTAHVKSSSEEIAAHMKSSSEEIAAHMKSSSEEITAHMKSSNVELTEYVKSSLEGFYETVQSQQQGMLHQMQHIMTEIEESHIRRQALAETHSTEFMEQISQIASHGMSRSVEELQTTLTGINQLMSSHSEQQSNLMNHVHALTEGVKNILGETTETVDSMHSVLIGSNDVIERLQAEAEVSSKNIEGISASLSKLARLEQDFQASVLAVKDLIISHDEKLKGEMHHLVEALTDSTKNNLTASESMRDTVERLDSSWNIHEETYHNFSEEVQDIFTELAHGITEYHTLLNNRMVETMNTFNLELSKATSELSAAVQDLTEGQDKFEDVVQRKIDELKHAKMENR